jgi:hypothetical protein
LATRVFLRKSELSAQKSVGARPAGSEGSDYQRIG